MILEDDWKYENDPENADDIRNKNNLKVPGFNLRALDCYLTLKLCVCFQKYKLTSHEKKIV